MNYRHDGESGYVLLEVMMALVVLVCGIMVTVDSYRASLQTGRQSAAKYRAALLLEGRLLELERTRHVDLTPENDPVLGPVFWEEEVRATDSTDWKEHRLVLNWGEAKENHVLELSTYLP